MQNLFTTSLRSDIIILLISDIYRFDDIGIIFLFRREDSNCISVFPLLYILTSINVVRMLEYLF